MPKVLSKKEIEPLKQAAAQKKPPKKVTKKQDEGNNIQKNEKKTQKNAKKVQKKTNYQNISREEAQEEFIKLRSKLFGLSREKSRAFVQEIKKDAANGDSVAQDFLSYLYKEGFDEILPESFPKQIEWELLSGAAGNEFANNKLQFYFNFALDQIVYDDNFSIICYKLGVNGSNYLSIFGQKICEALVQYMGIDAKSLNEQKDTYTPYRPELFRDFRRAIDKILPKLIEQWKN